MNVIMTALAPLESRHPRLGQGLWWLWFMRPQCLHAHAAPAGVLVCPAGRPGGVSPPSVASSPRAGGGTGSGRRTPPGCVCVCTAKSQANRSIPAKFFGTFEDKHRSSSISCICGVEERQK